MIIIIVTTIIMAIIFYTQNQSNFVIPYYSFKCYLLGEHLLLFLFR